MIMTEKKRTTLDYTELGDEVIKIIRGEKSECLSDRKVAKEVNTQNSTAITQSDVKTVRNRFDIPNKSTRQYLRRKFQFEVWCT